LARGQCGRFSVWRCPNERLVAEIDEVIGCRAGAVKQRVGRAPAGAICKKYRQFAETVSNLAREKDEPQAPLTRRDVADASCGP
jgi:hypothetical protein